MNIIHQVHKDHLISLVLQVHNLNINHIYQLCLNRVPTGSMSKVSTMSTNTIMSTMSMSSVETVHTQSHWLRCSDQKQISQPVSQHRLYLQIKYSM